MRWFYFIITLIFNTLALYSCSNNLQDNPEKEDVRPPLDIEIESHPRLLLKKGEESKILDLISRNESLNFAHNYIIEYSDKVLSLEPVEYKLTGKRLLSVSSEALTRIYFLSYSYRITGKKEYAERAEKEMLAVAAFKDWNPSHFLDVGEMVMAVAIGYDWLYEYLSDTIKRKLCKAIIEKAFLPANNSKYNWFYNSQSNWNQVCNAGLVLGALSIYEEEPEMCKNIIDKAIETLPNAHECYKPDGAYPEGFAYWGYGTGFEVTMLSALQTSLGTDYGFSKDEIFLRSPYYMLYMSAPTGYCYNYSDCGKNIPFQQGMFWFAAERNDPSLLIYELDYLKDIKKHIGSDNDKLLPNVLIFSKDLDINSINEPDENFWVSNGRKPLFIYRSGWSSVDDAYLGIVGGKANQSHGHMDSGSFIYEKNGVRWIPELGLQSYNTLESQGIKLGDMSQNGQRWEVFRIGKNGHSVIVINEENHLVDGNPQIDEIYKDNNMKGAKLDLTSLYSGKIANVTRTVYLDDKNDLHVKDYFKTNSDKANIQCMMIAVDGTTVNDGCIILEENGKKMKMSLIVNKGNINPVLKRIENNGDALKYYDQPNPGTCRLGYSVELPANGEYEIEVTLVEI